MVSSGTAALYLAVRHIKKREITYPIYSFPSVRNAILMANRQPIETELSDPNQDIFCHMFGNVNTTLTYPMRRGKIFIEDATQALGAKAGSDFIGTLGTYGVFSFASTRIITSGGQGGAVVSMNKSRIDEIRDLRDLDIRNDTKQRFNFGMTDLQAAIGREQLKKIDNFLERREEIFQKYLNGGLDLLRNKNEYITDVRYGAIVRAHKPLKMITDLGRRGVRALIPIEDLEVPNAKMFHQSYALTKNRVSLPIYPTLTDKYVDLIISVARKYI